MSVYFITGKLGNGKTLAGIYQAREHLRAGLPVATNIDLNLAKMVGDDKKRVKCFRLKDKPTVHDLHAIGDAYDHLPVRPSKYDESSFGALILDECATWFNSRTWNDKDRQALIDALVHIRKRHWNVYFIVQNISVVDKQARELLGEHVVYMRRMDNMAIPFVTSFFKLAGIRLTLPKRFFGIVKYGTEESSLKVDTWWFSPGELFSMYDTEQVFSPYYDSEAYCVLPPWFTVGQFRVPKDGRFYMKLTKIYLKKYSRVILLFLGLLGGAGAAIASMVGYFNQQMDDYKTQVSKDFEYKLKALNRSDENLKGDKDKDKDKKFNPFDLSSEQSSDFDFEPIDFIDSYFLKNKVRLSGYLKSKKKVDGIFEFFEGDRVVERLYISQLNSYGWSVTEKSNIFKISKDDKEYFVTSWPVSSVISSKPAMATRSSSSVSVPVNRTLVNPPSIGFYDDYSDSRLKEELGKDLRPVKTVF